MPAKKKRAHKDTEPKSKASPKSAARKSKIDLKPARKTLTDVQAKLRKLGAPTEITGEHVDAARGIATAMQEMVSGLKESIKRAAMADGKLTPGRSISAGGRLVHLKLRPGRRPGSKNPDDYERITEQIN